MYTCRERDEMESTGHVCVKLEDFILLCSERGLSHIIPSRSLRDTRSYMIGWLDHTLILETAHRPYEAARSKRSLHV